MEFLEAFGVFSGWHCQFSNVPLMISSYLGILMTFISFVAIIFIIVRKLILEIRSVDGHPWYVSLRLLVEFNCSVWESWDNICLRPIWK